LEPFLFPNAKNLWKKPTKGSFNQESGKNGNPESLMNGLDLSSGLKIIIMKEEC